MRHDKHSDKMHIEKVVGVGDQAVYAYHYPSQYVHCGDYPLKIGSARNNPVARILETQAAMQECPVVDLIIHCTDCVLLERGIHAALKHKRMGESFGREWFRTEPSEVLTAWLTFAAPENLPIGQQIRHYRHLNRMTQHELAASADVRQATVSDVECGNEGAAIRTISRMATELGMRLQLVPN